MRTPFQPALAAQLREVSTLQRVKLQTIKHVKLARHHMGPANHVCPREVFTSR